MIYYLVCVGLLSIIFVTGCVQKTTTYYPRKPNTTTNAVHNATMRPYRVKGKYYVPKMTRIGEKMYGISSWYGPNFHGKLTSNGEKYNMYEGTAAHKTLPMNTVVRVKNLENGKSTVVRINDRGPFVKGRIIDCSYKAGKEIGLDKAGIAKVEVEVLSTENNKSINQKQLSSKNSMMRRKKNEFGVQIGAFSSYDGAVRYLKQFKNKYKPYYPVIYDAVDKEKGTQLYRVILAGFISKAEANKFKEQTIGIL